MPRKKKTYNLKTRISNALRKVWRYYPERTQALKRCETGDHYYKTSKKTGNEYKVPYVRCEKCKEVFKGLQVDHIKPVVDVKGFEDWNTYIHRLFIDSKGLRSLCEECHSAITLVQNKRRKKWKQKKKKV